MSTAVCTACAMRWCWKASKGSRLAELRCSDCGGRLSRRRADNYATGAQMFATAGIARLAWPLGMTPEARIVELERVLKETSIARFRLSVEAELAAARKALASPHRASEELSHV